MEDIQTFDTLTYPIDISDASENQYLTSEFLSCGRFPIESLPAQSCSPQESQFAIF